MPERQWDFQLNLNLKAVWTGAQAAANIMKDNGGGTIVNISSAAAGGAAPFNGPYAVAKSGVNNLTQTLAVEMAPLGIRVNGVSPGPIPTEVFMEYLNLKEEEIPELGERFQIPLGRVGTPEDIAPAVVYLASEASCLDDGAYNPDQGRPLTGGSRCSRRRPTFDPDNSLQSVPLGPGTRQLHVLSEFTGLRAQQARRRTPPYIVKRYCRLSVRPRGVVAAWSRLLGPVLLQTAGPFMKLGQRPGMAPAPMA